MSYSLLDVLSDSIPDLRKRKLKPVTVAVIDSGIDSSHEMLHGRVHGAWEFIEENGVIVKRELPARNNNDDAGHGTAVGSIIAKIAPNARILDYKVLNASFSGSGNVMIAGLEAAIDGDAKIINMSLACLAKYRDEISHLLEKAYQKHKIVIASKRNVPKIDDLGFPAELSSCISVENHNYDNNPFFIDHIDEQPIEFAAHGENILVALNGGGYYRLTGTSFATPTVSANVALLLGAYPDLELYEVKSVLKHHSRLRSFADKEIVNPLEVATCYSKKGGNGIQEHKCPYCKNLLKTHDAFALVSCPFCQNVFSLFPSLDKNLWNHVIRQLKISIPLTYFYHNAQHTKEVITHAYIFSRRYSSISPKAEKCLMTAALLHDYGYVEQYDKNEPVAARYAAELLPEYGYKDDEIRLIQSLILATTMPVSPRTLLEKIICDADVAHIGTEKFVDKSLLLRRELAAQGKQWDDKEYFKMEIDFLSRHHFSQKWLENERKDSRARAIADLEAKLKRKK